MGNSLVFFVLLLFVYLSWVVTFVVKLKKSSRHHSDIVKYEREEIEEVIERVYERAISFEKCKNFTKALQKNLKHQIDSFITATTIDYGLAIDCLNSLKDTVDINDMTFCVGNDLINSLLREKMRICYQKSIVFDVVADLTEVDIQEEHLFFVFSNLLDLVIKDIDKIENSKEKKRRNKIAIRASRSNLKNDSFFVLQIAYNINSNIYSDINNNKKAYDMLNLFLDYHNGAMVSQNKNYKHIKTIAIPLAGEECQEDNKDKQDPQERFVSSKKILSKF